jgi:hypothetical protein
VVAVIGMAATAIGMVAAVTAVATGPAATVAVGTAMGIDRH